MKRNVLYCETCLALLGCLEDDIVPCWDCEEEVCQDPDECVMIHVPNHVCEKYAGHA